MGERKISQTFSDTKKDFHNAWKLLKENYKAYLSTEIFAGIAFVISLFLISLILWIFSAFSETTLREFLTNFSNNMILSHILRIMVSLIFIFIFFGFLNSQFGLSHEIMSSGEMFAEFESSFGYFKKFWWQYPVLTFIILAINVLIPISYRLDIAELLNNELLAIFILIVLWLIFFIWFIIFISTLPSITFQGNFKHAFIESFRMVKSNFKRMIVTWGIFFLIFVFPGFLIMLVTSVYFSWVTISLNIIYIFVLSFIGFPLMSLIATGLYKNVNIERFKSLE